MADFRWIDVDLDITSEISFLDGHTEPGPSTELRSRIETREAGREVLKLIQRTIGSLHNDSFGARVRRDLRQMIVPVDEEKRAKVKLDVTYYVRLTATAYMVDGTTTDLSEYKEFTEPL